MAISWLLVFIIPLSASLGADSLEECRQQPPEEGGLDSVSMLQVTQDLHNAILSENVRRIDFKGPIGAWPMLSQAQNLTHEAKKRMLQGEMAKAAEAGNFIKAGDLQAQLKKMEKLFIAADSPPEAGKRTTFEPGKSKVGKEHAKSDVEHVEHHHEHRHAHRDEEHAWTQFDVLAASMLLGACVMIMALMHVVHWRDDDIRFYGWYTMQSVIGIFVGVMTFHTVNECLVLSLADQWLPTKREPSLKLCVIQYIHFTLWLYWAQFIAAFHSGVIFEDVEDQAQNPMEEQYWVLADHLRADEGKKIHSSYVRNTDHTTKSFTKNGELPVRKAFAEREKRSTILKAWCTISAHITGFAAIEAAGCMQHIEPFKSSVFLAVAPIVINQVYVNVMFVISKGIRKHMEEAAKAEGGKGLRAKLYDEEMSEAEFDISALSWSFLAVQVVRFGLVGTLPDMRGEQATPGRRTIANLFLIGLGFGGSCVVGIYIKRLLKSDARRDVLLSEEETGIGAKLVHTLFIGLSMCFAWCSLFSAQWAYTSIEICGGGNCSIETVVGKIMMASFLCVLVLCVIFLLDKIDDAMKDEDRPGVNEVVDRIITALSVLAGFSWEQAFDGGIEAIADQTIYPVTVEVLLQWTVWLVVVPAWRMYIVHPYMVLLSVRKEGYVSTTCFDEKEPDKLQEYPS